MGKTGTYEPFCIIVYFIVGSETIEGGNTGVKRCHTAFVDAVHAQPSIVWSNRASITLRVLQPPRIAANLEHVRMDYREQVRKGPIRFRFVVVVVLCCRTVA